MSNLPFSPNRWPALLLLAVAVFGPPSAAVLTFTHAVTQNPWLTVLLILLYELVVFIVSLAVKVWQRLEQPWIEDIATILDHFVRSVLSGYYRHYCRYFFYEHRDLDVKGMSTQGIYTLDLENVFVELRIDPKPAHQASADPLRLPAELRTGSHTIWKYLAAPLLLDQHLVVLGPPGSGKTTLLKHVAITLLRRSSPRHMPPYARKLPILLFLRNHSAAIQNIADYSLTDAIRAQLAKWQRPMPLGWIEHRLLRGQCLVLLDGLDELADPEVRLRGAEWVQQQMVAYGNNRFVITSRPFGFRSNPLSGVTVLEVQPFTFDQVQQFVHNWYVANEIKSAVRDDPGVRMKAREEAQDLLRRLQDTPALFALVVNPLLLTMISTVHRYRGSLPGARVTLYKDICEVFLGKRQEARGIQQDLRTDQRQLVLQPLAYHMMQYGLREIPSIQAEETIKQPLRNVSAEISPHSFLQSIENSSGLLLEREQGIYAFAHMTFQEYLAAMHVRENSLEETLAEQVDSSWWHETIRLYCAQADATAIVRTCLVRHVPSVAALSLALECVDEARNIDAEVKRHLNQVINQGIEGPDSELRRVAAEAFLARRLRHMRAVNERIAIDTSLVTHAEYQLFLDEQQVQGKWYQPDHWSGVSFPVGSGRRPVLGVRWSDALAFCEWLTERDIGVWQYRLPQADDYVQKDERIVRSLSEATGYWMAEQGHFTWAKGRPPFSLQRQILGTFPNDIISAIDLDFASTRAIDLDFASTRAIDLELASDLSIAFSIVRDLARAPSREFTSVLSNAISIAHYLIHRSDRLYPIVSDLYVILYLLNERFEGRLPPYEGILIVKERKKEMLA